MPYRDHKKAAIQLPFCVSCRSPGFQQSDGFLPNPYAKPLFLHTNHPKTNHLYAKQAILHTNQLKTGHLYAKTPVLHTKKIG